MLPSRPPASQIKKTPKLFSFPAAIAQTNKSKKKKKRKKKRKGRKKEIALKEKDTMRECNTPSDIV
jgi:hypothetical protein